MKIQSWKRHAVVWTACVLAAGCATWPAPWRLPGNEAGVRTTLEVFRDGFKEGDAGKIVSVYSESYKDAGARGEAGFRTHLEAMAENHKLQEVTISLDDVDIVVDDGEASAGPVMFQGPGGTVQLDMYLARQRGKWLINGIEMRNEEALQE